MFGLENIKDREDGKKIHLSTMFWKKFNMENCNPANSSMKLDKTMCSNTHEDIQSMKDVPFMEAVGSLFYVAQVTRPAIAYAVNMVSQF